MNHVIFAQNGEITVGPVTVSAERLRELNNHLMLFYTGIERTASNIAETYVTDVETKKSQLRIMKHLVEEGIAILNKGNNINDFGALLHEGWQVKRRLECQGLQFHTSMNSTPMRWPRRARRQATRGRWRWVFAFVCAADLARARIVRPLKKFIHVPFHFEFAGSQIIFFEPERDYSAEDKMSRFAGI